VITVTAEDRAIGYDTAAGSAKFGATVLISTLGPGAVSNVAKVYGGMRAACTTGKVLAGLDAVHNSVDVGKSVADIRQNGLTVGNALQVGSGLLGIVGNVSTIKNTSCFAPGTPLLTPDGSKFIEDIRVGDLVLSRDEDDPEGPFVAKRVANLFQNYSPLVDLHVGGRVIRTTPEHPFWVVGRGWVSAQQIEAGDSLLGAVGERTVVESIEGSTESTVVYNLAIEQYHTYLVGATLWGFSVWVHNSSYPDAPTGTYNPAPASLPANTGGKTAGVLQVQGQSPLPLASGIRGPSQAIRGQGLPGFNGNQLTHVEGHAAAYMRSNGIKEAVLDINKVPCTAGSGGGCEGLLAKMLPEGASLRVRGPGGYDRTFVGLPD
jgi:hypothetical protein